MDDTIRVRATEKRIQITFRGAFIEDDAALGIMFLRSARPAIMATGRCATALPQSLSTFVPSSTDREEDRRARVVPLEGARWWKCGEFAPLPKGTPIDEHVGEILVLRPFERSMYSTMCIAQFTDYHVSTILDQVLGFGPRRWWFGRRRRVELELPIPSDSDELHDQLARALMTHFAAGERTLLNGRPLRVRKPRAWRDLTWEHAHHTIALVAGVLLLAARPYMPGMAIRNTTLYFRVVAFFCVISVAAAVSEYHKFRYR